MFIIRRYDKIQRNTRVLFHIKNSSQYLMTNDTGTETGRYRVLSSDRNGKIVMEGYMLGSIFAHEPDIIPDLEIVDCTFEELNPAYFNRNVVADGLIGLAVGDAFGVPVEFLSRQAVRDIKLDDMVGKGCNLSFASGWSEIIPPGAWSDDTSMTIAAMSSIIENGGRIDYDDIMSRFLRWWEEGAYSSLEYPFGLGGTVGRALERFKQGVPASMCGGTGIRDNGNGALMRIFPFSIYCIIKDYTDEETLEVIRQAAGLTHAHEITAMSCFLYTLFLRECIRTKNPVRAYNLVFHNSSHRYRQFFSDEAIQAHKLLLDNNFFGSFDCDSIPESGYVVDSLAVSVYSILRTHNYEDAVKMAVGFGYDTDTNAAITGSIAGALYGADQIPGRWKSALLKREELVLTGTQFSDCMQHR